MAQERGPRAHSPNDKARHWGTSNMAFLTDKISSKPVSFRIDTHDSGNGGRIEVVAHSGLRQPGIDGIGIEWDLLRFAGEFPGLRKLSLNVIGLACMPDLEFLKNKRPVRPYKNMLYLGGDLQLTVPENPVLNLCTQTFSVGNVVGLTIVTPHCEAQVWPKP